MKKGIHRREKKPKLYEFNDQLPAAEFNYFTVTQEKNAAADEEYAHGW